MSRFIDGQLPVSWFAPTGAVAISPAAMVMARAFIEQARSTAPDADWVAVFDWSETRRIRQKGTNDWTDLGAGLDLAAYRREQVPESAIAESNGLGVAVKMPGDVLRASRHQLIDRQPDLPGGLALL